MFIIKPLPVARNHCVHTMLFTGISVNAYKRPIHSKMKLVIADIVQTNFGELLLKHRAVYNDIFVADIAQTNFGELLLKH